MQRNFWGEAEATPQLTWGRRSCIVSGLMSAVSYLHHHDSKGPCYHRDIKPANIMLTISLSPKLSDCGLSRFLPQDRPDQPRRTMQLTTGAGPAGTPGFMCRRYISTGQFDAKSLGFAWIWVQILGIQNSRAVVSNVIFAYLCGLEIIWKLFPACYGDFQEEQVDVKVGGLFDWDHDSAADHGRARIRQSLDNKRFENIIFLMIE